MKARTILVFLALSTACSTEITIDGLEEDLGLQSATWLDVTEITEDDTFHTESIWVTDQDDACDSARTNYALVGAFYSDLASLDEQAGSWCDDYRALLETLAEELDWPGALLDVSVFDPDLVELTIADGVYTQGFSVTLWVAREGKNWATGQLENLDSECNAIQFDAWNLYADIWDNPEGGSGTIELEVEGDEVQMTATDVLLSDQELQDDPDITITEAEVTAEHCEVTADFSGS